MSSYERDELRREEFEHDNPRCRTHGIHGCDECEERYAVPDEVWVSDPLDGTGIDDER